MSTLEEGPMASTAISHAYEKRMMVFGGRSSRELAAKIAQKLEIDLGQVTLKTFADGEVYCRYEESIRGADVFIVQSTCHNERTGMTPNDSLVELLAMIDAAQGASAHRIIAVMPWYGYARQDKKSAPREPITARVVAKCLEAVGVDRILTMDLHAGQVQGFFDVPVDHMTAMPMLTQWFIDQELTEELVIVSPDAGRVKTARNFARRVGTQWAVMEKERPAQAVAEIGYVVGDVKGKTAVLVDDMIATAGTLTAAAQTALDEGAARVISVATHGVFSGPAYERLADSAIERIVVTDTIPLGPGANIGAGSITANYDGFTKNRTTIGRDVRIGVDTMLIARVEVGDSAYTGAGAVLKDDVPEGALAVSENSQRNIDGYAADKAAKMREEQDK